MKKIIKHLKREWRRLTSPTPAVWKKVRTTAASVTGSIAASLVAVNNIPGLEAYVSDGVKTVLAYIAMASGALVYIASRKVDLAQIKKQKKTQPDD